MAESYATQRYGDSTRTVKAVDSEAIPGQPVAAVPVPVAAHHTSDDEGSERTDLKLLGHGEVAVRHQVPFAVHAHKRAQEGTGRCGELSALDVQVGASAVGSG